MPFSKTAILLLVVCASAMAFGSDWPNWRGPNYNGISSESNWDPKVLESPDVAWRAEIGTGFSTVSVADGKAYTMGNIDKKTDVVYCFDALTGQEKWRYEYAERLNPKFYEGGSSATPTVYNGKVYTLSKSGVALCLDTETGDVIWKKSLSFKPPNWGFSSSALIVDDLVIYNVGTAGLALNQETGEIIWKSDNGASGYATPVPYQQDSKACVCIFGKNKLMGIEAKSGTILWSYPWKTNNDVNAADPVIFDKKVFITSGYGHGCALIDISGPEPSLVWKNKNMRSQMSGPVLIDGFLYGFDDNKLVCIDWKTGKKKWSRKDPGKGSLCATGDRLIVIGEKGQLFIVQATPEGYEELSSAQVLKHICWSMPVLANGHIYVRDAKKNVLNNLVCIEIQKAEKQKPEATVIQDWPQWQGPNRDNVSTEIGLAKQWPVEGPKMLWSAQGIGGGYSSVAIAEGKIYTTGTDKEQGVLSCFDLNGKQLWQVDYGPEWKRSFPGARCTPTIKDGYVYIISGTGQVACFKAQDGENVWRIDALGMFEGQYPNWGIAESPLVLNGKVIFTMGGKKALMAAFDKKDGSVIWATPANGDTSAFCSPIAFEWGDKMIIATMTSNNITGIDEKTGGVLFSYPVSNYVEGEVQGTHPNSPIFYNGKIFVSSGYDMGSVQIELSEDGKSVKEVWKNPEMDNHHGGVILLNGFLYGANWQSNKQGKWMCVDWATGKTMYEQEWCNKGSLTSADGMLYCYEEGTGTVGLVSAKSSGFNLLSSFQITQGNGEHWAHPVVCGKQLYVRHGDVLMAFDISG